MIRLIFAFVIALASTSLSLGQGLLVYDQHNSSYVSDIEYIDDSTYVVVLVTGDERDLAMVAMYQGTELIYDYGYIDKGTTFDIKKRGDSLYLDYIFHYDCDIITNGFRSIPLDTNWVDDEERYASTLYWGRIYQAELFNNNVKVLLNDQNRLMYMDTSRLPFFTEQLTTGLHSVLKKIDDNNIILLGDHSSIIRNVAKLDSSDLRLIHSNNKCIDFADYNDKYYLLGSDRLSVFNKDGQLFDNIIIPNNLQAYDMIIDNKNVLTILGRKNQQENYSYHIFQLVENNEWVETFSIYDLFLWFREMQINPKNEIILLGYIDRNTSLINFPEMGILLNTTETPKNSPDLSIEFSGMSIKDTTHEASIINYFVTVNNLSDVDAYNVNVHSTKYAYFNSFYYLYCQFPTAKTLIPYIPANSSVDLSLDGYITDFMELNPEVCFYTSGADKRNDINKEDNITCELNLDIKDIEIKETALDLFPNPASKTIRSKSAQPNDIFEVIDLQGRVLKRINYEGGINISDMLPGFYFARNLKSQEVSKFMKL